MFMFIFVSVGAHACAALSFILWSIVYTHRWGRDADARRASRTRRYLHIASRVRSARCWLVENGAHSLWGHLSIDQPDLSGGMARP